MRIFTKLLSCMMVACVALMTACGTDPVEQKPKDDTLKVTVDQEVINVGAQEGRHCVGYTIANGISGIDIVAESDATWLHSFETKESKLWFSVNTNPSNKEREAQIAIRYPNHGIVLIKVIQAPYDGTTFELKITDESSTSCKSVITPSSDDIIYLPYLAEKDYLLTAGIVDEQDLFMDDYNYYMSIIKEYSVEDIESFMLMNDMVFKGESEIKWTGMNPNKEYVLYVYAIEFTADKLDYKIASPVSYIMFELPAGKLEKVEFDVEVKVSGPEVEYIFEPIGYDGKYFIQVFEQGEYMYLAEDQTPDEGYCTMVSKTWIDTINIYMQSGYTAEQLMEIMCLQGADSYTELRKADTNYCMIFYAIGMVDGLPQVTSEPYKVNFRTGVVEPSDMTFDVKVENCYVRVADISVTPSSNEPYVATFVKKSDVSGTTNEEILNWLSMYQLNTYRGAVSSHVANLEPETEYSLFVFGYYGGVITTDLTRVDFTTEPEGKGENSVIRVDWCAPYSLKELEMSDPDKYYNYGMFENMGWYAMWSEIVTEKPSDDVYYCIYRAEKLAQSGEQEIFEDLVSYPSPKVQLLTGESGVLYVMCAVTMDYKGNYSEMWVSEPFRYDYNEETKRPIDELLNKLNEANPESEPARQSLSITEMRK